MDWDIGIYGMNWDWDGGIYGMIRRLDIDGMMGF
jgi:hypothetical protein